MKRYSPEISKVYSILKKEFSKNRVPVVELIKMQTRDPFKVLLATILSARTKDQTTAAASARLFKRVRDLSGLEHLSIPEIEQLIFPVGFYHEKAKHLKQLPSVLRDLFAGGIPSTVDELIKLPGVGRKTANLVVAVAFNKPAVCVDVHVHRIFNRLGFLVSVTALETEMTLRKTLPGKYWTTFNSYFVSFGQHTCLPLNPRCELCPVYKYCGRVNAKTKNPRQLPV